MMCVGKLRVHSEFLYGMKFSLMLKGAVYKSYVRPTMLHRSEAWCLNESEMGLLWKKRSMVSAMCGVHLKDRKRSTNLNETINQLAIANSVRWYGHMLMRENGHVMRRKYDFEDKGQRKKGWPKRTWKK